MSTMGQPMMNYMNMQSSWSLIPGNDNLGSNMQSGMSNQNNNNQQMNMQFMQPNMQQTYEPQLLNF